MLSFRGKVLLCRERVSNGGEVHEVTQLESQSRHERLQVCGPPRVDACEIVNM